MRLVPLRPPGPNARKARAFSTEISQLRSEGYTFEAIREALAGAGVHVSNSTVQREVARAGRAAASVEPEAASSTAGWPTSAALLPPPAPPPRPPRPPQTPAPAPAMEDLPPALPSAVDPKDRRSGKEIAEEFVNSQITNPLLRAKEKK